MYDALDALLCNNKHAAHLMIGCLGTGVVYVAIHKKLKKIGAPIGKGVAGSGKTTVMNVMRAL